MNEKHNEMPLQEALEPILRVVGQLNGHFVFTSEDGRRFVIARAEALEEARVEQKVEQQLPLPAADVVRDAIQKNMSDIDEEILERINRDIAISATVDEEELVEENAEEEEFVFPQVPEADSSPAARPTPPPPPVRFEPIKGDLAPELQD